MWFSVNNSSFTDNCILMRMKKDGCLNVVLNICVVIEKALIRNTMVS